MSESEKAWKKSQKSYKGSEMQAFCTGYEMAADKYKAELEQLKNPWISVQDELPPEFNPDDTYLVLVDDGDPDPTYFGLPVTSVYETLAEYD